MLFNSFAAHLITEAIDIDGLNKKLDSRQFKSCESFEKESMGFISPNGGTELTHVVNGCVMFAVRTESKIIPKSAIKAGIKARIEKMGVKVSKSDRLQVIDEVTHELTARALSDFKDVYGYIDRANNFVLINTTSANKAEDILGLIRSCLGSFKTVPISTNFDTRQVMTQWLNVGISSNLTISCDCTLSNDDNQTVKIGNIDLHSKEVRQHIEKGMMVDSISLRYQDILLFKINKHFVLSGIKFNLTKEKHINKDDAMAIFDSEFAIMSGEFRNVLIELIELFGGLVK